MKSITLFFTLLSISCLAQVGIGTVTPSATLEIQSSNPAAPLNTDGLLIPKIDEFPNTNPTALQDGMLVYATGDGGVSKGFYSWDSAVTSWILATGAKNIDDLIDGKIGGGGYSIYFGVDAGTNDNILTSHNIGIGLESLHTNTDGSTNVAIGTRSLHANTTGYGNAALGWSTLENNTTGNFSTAIGSSALMNNTTGTINAAIGYESLLSNTIGNDNIAIGYRTLRSNIDGHLNTAIGTEALTNNSSGSNNIGIGYNSLVSNSSGSGNIAVGRGSLGGNTTGFSNTALGYEALNSNGVGFRNTAVGASSLESNSNGNYNTVIGYDAYKDNTSGSNNTILGYEAGIDVNGDNNVFVGFQAGTPIIPNNISGTICIGYQSGATTIGNNNLYIDNSATIDPLIYGEFDTNILNFSADVGINTKTPSASLHVNHQSGSGTEGFVLSNQTDTDAWRMYVQWNSNTLALMYNNVNVGNFDDVSGIYTAVSDRNRKKNIAPTASILDKIQLLEVKDYNFKNQLDNKRYTGLIAQDVEELFPHLVVPPNEEIDNYTMDYSGFGVLAIKAIQEQQEQIETLKLQLEHQQKDLLEIKSLLQAHN